jgi:hypothetical protein
MTARWLFRVALLISLAATAANADGPPTRIFHIGIVAGLPRSSPEHAAFEERLRELGSPPWTVRGRNISAACWGATATSFGTIPSQPSVWCARS